jgi:formylglycine-generating enzyme required for sulfatase activity
MTQAIFISYASQDADFARRICAVLRSQGLEVWFDQSELRGGDAWDQSIRRQIRDCALFIPLISANTEARLEGYFRLEWRLADQRTHLMAKGKPFLVPAVIDNTKDTDAHVPDSFLDVQWTRLTDEESITSFAERVAKLLDGRGTAGKSVSEGAPVLGVRESPNPVAPAKAGAQFDVGNLGPGLHRGDHSESAADEVGRAPQPTPRPNRRPFLIIAVASALIVAAIAANVVIKHQRTVRFFEESLPRIAELSRAGKFMEAFLLAQSIEAAGGADPLTAAMRNDFSRPVNVTSTPAGARIELRPYDAKRNDGAWIALGNAPLEKVRVPRGVMEWRASLPDGAVHVLTQAAVPDMQLKFAPVKESMDGGIVPVAAGKIGLVGLVGLKLASEVELEAFSIDRLEVRNRDFARFVAAGGYAKEDYWQEPMTDGTRRVPFAEAMGRFKDATGRPGPALWKLGNFPEGEADLPVRGVSWFEAAAYARCAGKELPGMFHWYRADSDNNTFLLVPAVLPSANFGDASGSGSKGPRASSASRTIGAFGAVDMAGNVREWVATRTDKGRAIAVGGSWLDVQYQYNYATPYSPWVRLEDVGFRCMKRSGDAQDKAARNEKADAPAMETKVRGSLERKPVTDADYAAFTRFFEKSRAPLDLRAEPGDSPASPYWTRTQVSYFAGHGNERMNAFLYLPKNAKPPHQTVVFMHGSNILDINKPYEKVGETSTGWVFPEMIVRGGRALLVPIWKGTYERHAPIEADRDFARERVRQWVAEMQRSVDFLHTREDIDKTRIGYYGVSMGSVWAPQMLAMEPRVSAAVFLAGGIEGVLDDGDYLTPELDGATYAPRVKAAVLMINGREDIRFPFETSQVPLFKLLGSPPDKKAHKTYPGGHSTLGWFDAMSRDTHDWFDQQFGPVTAVAR